VASRTNHGVGRGGARIFLPSMTRERHVRWLLGRPHPNRSRTRPAISMTEDCDRFWGADTSFGEVVRDTGAVDARRIVDRAAWMVAAVATTPGHGRAASCRWNVRQPRF